MRNELKHIEEIERYLTQKMSGEELHAFEQQLKLDDGLRFDVNLQKQLMTEIQVDAFKKEALAFHDSFVSSSLKSKSWKYFLNSIFVVGAIGIGIFLFQIINHNENDRENNYSASTGIPSNTTQKGLWVDSNNSGALLASNENNTNHSSKTFTSYPTTPNKRIESVSTEQINIPLVPDYSEPHRNFLVPFEEHRIAGNKSQIVQLENYPVAIEIHENSFSDKNEHTISDTLTLKYRAFNDLAELAFSGISGTNAQHTLNSIELFEIRFFHGQEEVYLKKGKTMALKLNPKRGLDQTKLFYRNEVRHEWVEENQQQQKFTEQEAIQPCSEIKEFGQLWIKLSDSETASEVNEFTLMDERGNEMKRCFSDSGYVVFAVSPGEHKYTITSNSSTKNKSLFTNNYKVKNIVVTIPQHKRTFVHVQAKSRGIKKNSVSTKNTEGSTVRQRMNAYRVLDIHPPVRNPFKEKSQLSWNNVTELKNATTISKTGIYTIAQAIHQPNKISCTFRWTDSQGNVWNPYLVVGLDLRYLSIQNAEKGVLHFDTKGRNMILAVDESYRLHVISENSFKHYGIIASGTYTITGENYSNDILTIKDLKKLLNQ